VDRVSIRSFRAPDLVERGLRDLARSRIDTTWEVVFQPLGARFFEAREDTARIATLFREDAFHAPEGHFARMVLRVEPRLAEGLAALEPRAVERRLEEATRDARSCASSPAPRGSTWRASSRPPAGTSSRSRTST
jgi:hypothetical protein